MHGQSLESRKAIEKPKRIGEPSSSTLHQRQKVRIPQFSRLQHCLTAQVTEGTCITYIQKYNVATGGMSVSRNLHQNQPCLCGTRKCLRTIQILALMIPEVGD